MTTLDDSPRNDLSLVADVRDGWRDAFGELYRRHHGAALRYALMLTGGNDTQAQDLVAEAFARVLRATSDGGGSTVAFRPYLMSAIRHEYLAELRRSGKIDLVDSADELDGMSPNGVPDDRFLDPHVASAMQRLPARWRTVLWRTEVDGDKPAEVASSMGISANAAAALASRAREGLRQEYLQEHVAGARRECGPYASRLGRLVRGALSPREQQLVETHLRLCTDCSRARAQLRGLNDRIHTILPLIVGAGALWPGPGLSSLSGLPAAAGGGSSWVGSACVAGAGAVAAPTTVATATAGVGVAGVVTAGFAKVAATAAAVVAGSATAFGFAANPAPIEDHANDPLIAVTPTAESSEPAVATVPPTPTPTPTPTEGLLADDALPAGADPESAVEVASSLMAPEQSEGEGGNPVGDAGGPPTAPVSSGESPDGSTPTGEQSSSPSAGGGDSGSSPDSSSPPDGSATPPPSQSQPDPEGDQGGKGDGGKDLSPGGSESTGTSPWSSSSPERTRPHSSEATRGGAAARAFIREWRNARESHSVPRWPGMRWFGGR